MRILATYRSTDPRRPHTDRRHSAGFTLLEMVVVLAIMALVTGIAAVRVFAMVGSWREHTQLESIEQQFAHLPVLARQRGREILLPPPKPTDASTGSSTDTSLQVTPAGATDDEPALLLPDGWLVHFDHRLRIRSNGFCEGARIDIQHGDRHEWRQVLPPFCQLVNDNANSQP